MIHFIKHTFSTSSSVQKTDNCLTFLDLPLEIILVILEHLGYSSLRSFSQASKSAYRSAQVALRPYAVVRYDHDAAIRLVSDEAKGSVRCLALAKAFSVKPPLKDPGEAEELQNVFNGFDQVTSIKMSGGMLFLSWSTMDAFCTTVGSRNLTMLDLAITPAFRENTSLGSTVSLSYMARPRSF